MRRVAILGILAASMGGCMAGGPDTAETLPQGLTVLQAEAGALSLAYRSADVVIYMESLRGTPTPEPYQRTKTSPRFQMDARFTDDQGYVFYSQQGGDGWLDPTWAEDLQRQVHDRPEAASNEVLFRLATEAASVMHAEIERQVGPELAAALAPEIRAIHDFASRASRIYRDQLVVY